MRLVILSDIHANLAALDAVLDDAAERQPDAMLCLGDTVGYGPDPGACVDRVAEACEVSVLGNHDAAVARDEGLEVLPPDGQAAAWLHRTLLSDAQRAWLAARPLVAVRHGVTLAHAAPVSPGVWPRLDSFHAVQEQFGGFDTEVCFVGHSHRPAVVSDTLGVTRVRPGHRYLINVGSVGQPRDHDPRAAYGVLDTRTMAYELVRVHYDYTRTQAHLRALGLPETLGVRLARGE